MNASLDLFRLSDSSPASARALPFRTLIERVEIMRLLADTSLGIEYLAIDHASQTEVTLKEYLPSRLARREDLIMLPQTRSDAAALALGLRAFVAEGRLLARIDHPALIHVTDVIEANGTAYQVTPRHGGTHLLQVRLEMAGAPDEQALRALLDGLLGALDALHQRGSLHGAVAPGNILLLADDRPLLLGPNLARSKIASGLVETLMAAVEPSFAAPEQRLPSQTRPIGPWTDLYGLAETMRFCISGAMPPPADEPHGRGSRETMTPLVQRLFGDSASAHYSKSLLDALDAALQANPAARPQSVAEFRAVLGAEPAPIAPPHEGGLRAANCLPVRTAPRAEPDFEIGGILPPPTTAPISTVPVEAPTAAAQITLFRPPRSRRGALWAGGALMLLLAAGTYGWRTIDQSVRVELPASVVSAVATDTPMAATPTPTPAAEKATTRVAPAVSAPTPVLAAPPKKAAATASPASPRDGCAGRTQFALYRCMQAQCAQRGLARHPQCEHLRSTDSVD